MNYVRQRALLSVSDKSGLVPFAERLAAMGFELISSGGTARHLREAGLAPIAVSKITGFPEILDGRVKTLHPKIHGALLARYELEDHRAQLESHGIAGLSLVVVNLYPFAQTIAKEGTTVADAIEQIDIGGPAMIRAAAKNFQNIAVLTDPADYPRFLDECDETGATELAFRLAMARKAFHHTFAYDLKIADYLDDVQHGETGPQHAPSEATPPVFRLSARKSQALRYGENPHQAAAFYQYDDASADAVVQHQGKLLSFNNLVDMESAWRCVREFSRPTAVIIKHTNPCGVGCHEDLEAAFRRARQVDPVSAFGGVIAFNSEVDGATAKAVNEQFAELVIAPSFHEKALKRFKRKKNLRVLEIQTAGPVSNWDVKCLEHGLLVQERDAKRVAFEQWRQVSQRAAAAGEIEALKMAWALIIHVKSNAIVYADAHGAVGIGAGQMSRVDSARVGIHKAQEAGLSVAGSAMASDAFFPFRDSVDAAAAAGVRAIVEPGGSIRDEEVIQAADEHGIALYFTGTRHFKH